MRIDAQIKTGRPVNSFKSALSLLNVRNLEDTRERRLWKCACVPNNLLRDSKTSRCHLAYFCLLINYKRQVRLIVVNGSQLSLQ